MIISSSAEGIQALTAAYRDEGKTIGFVPTMGALHAGHLSLVKQAKTECDVTVVSIFVNPKQFGPTEDFKTYPRTLEADTDLLSPLEPDLLFTPTLEAIYPRSLNLSNLHYPLPEMASWYCGAIRPGHFEGVCTVVRRFFDLIRPNSAYFGEKDYQQLSIISQMVRDLSLPIRVVGCPILREPSGLAMSSRNQYLSKQDALHAATIYASFLHTHQIFLDNTTDTDLLRGAFLSQLSEHIVPEYIEIVDPISLEPQTEARFTDKILFAGRLGTTRLIDNYSL